jgi:acetyltransferase-like isoleucine patch superfamily enzyme
MKINKVKIADNVVYGENFSVYEPCNLYGCTFGNDCFVAPFVEIQKDVHIGNDTKIESHTFICELVTIGNDCFIGHGVMFINDLFSIGKPAGGNKEIWKKTNIGNNVSIGSNSTILPVNICDNVVIGAGAVVTKDIDESGIYIGNPAKKLRNI